jgi:hypothetical protein
MLVMAWKNIYMIIYNSDMAQAAGTGGGLRDAEQEILEIEEIYAVYGGSLYVEPSCV